RCSGRSHGYSPYRFAGEHNAHHHFFSYGRRRGQATVCGALGGNGTNTLRLGVYVAWCGAVRDSDLPAGSQIRLNTYRSNMVDGQSHHETASSRDVRLNPDLPPVSFYDMFYNREAKARTSQLAGARLVDPIESLEDSGTIPLGDPYAGVGHRQINLIAERAAGGGA